MPASDDADTARMLLREHGAFKAWCLLRTKAIHASISGDGRAVSESLALQQELQRIVGEQTQCETQARAADRPLDHHSEPLMRTQFIKPRQYQPQ